MSPRRFVISLLILLIIGNCAYATYTPPCSTPGVFDLISPANGECRAKDGITLSWQTSTNASSYIVYLDTSNPPTTWRANPQGTTWNVPSGLLNPGTTYYWRIKAGHCGSGCTCSPSVWSTSTYNFTTKPGQASSPNPGNGASGVSIITQLGWTAGQGADSHHLYLSKTLAEVTSRSTNADKELVSAPYDPGTLDESTQYYWCVDEVKGTCETAGDVWSFTTETIIPSPGTPTNIDVTAVTSNGIQVSWEHVGDDEDGFRIYRKKEGESSFTNIGTVGPDTTLYFDIPVDDFWTYYYYVCAFNEGPEECSQTDQDTTPLAAPSSFTATATNTTQIQLSWHDNSNHESGYKIERKTGLLGSYSEIHTTNSNVESYLDTNLDTALTYYYRVLAYNGTYESSYSTQVDESPLPNKLTGLAVTKIVNRKVYLYWNDNTEADFSVYRLYRSCTQGSGYVVIADNLSSSNYVDSAVIGNTSYYYVVAAVDKMGGQSVFSDEKVVPELPPEKPTNFIVSSVPSDPGRLELKWTDNSDYEDGFMIRRRAGTGEFMDLPAKGANEIHHSETGLISSEVYYYQLYAFNTGGDSSIVEAYNSPCPQVPTGFDVEAGDGEVMLTWTGNSESDLAGYNIYRRLGSGGMWSKINYVLSPITSYKDTNVTNGQTYYYKITAIDEYASESAFSDVDSDTPQDVPPAAPSDVKVASVQGSPDKLQLWWTDNSDDEQGFKIQRRTATGQYGESFVVVGENITGYLDTIDLVSSETYFYRICAYDAGGDSDWAESSPSKSPCPDKPTGLFAAAGDGQVELLWNANSESDVINGGGYNVYRSISSSGLYVKLNSPLVGFGELPYTDNTVTNGTTYYYVVTAVDNSSSESGYSDPVTVIPEAADVVAPTGLTATLDCGVHLSWSYEGEGTPAGYKIHRGTSIGGPYMEIDVIASEELAYDDDITVSSSNSSEVYYYVVTAFDAGGSESGYSNETSASITYKVRNSSTNTWYCSIQAAIDVAYEGQEIVVSAGTYHEHLHFTDRKITLTSQTPAEPESTVIDGDYTANTSVMEFLPGDADSVIRGFTIKGGSASLGAGIYCEDASPKLESCVISYNSSATGTGGGMYNCQGGHPELVDCTFSSNVAGSNGGGIANVGSTSQITLTNCIFNSNLASTSNGAGIRNEGVMSLSGCTFTGNSANSGGAISNDSTGTLNVHNCLFTDNQANENGFSGGAIRVHNGQVTVTNCVFVGNSANNATAGDGGAISIDTNGELTLRNCTLSNNSADHNGGGIYISSGDPVLQNCILWGNTDSGSSTEDAQIYVSAGTPDITYSCIEGWSQGGTGNTDENPSLDTDHYHLLTGSGCIDAGDPGYVFDEAHTDIDGSRRFCGTAVDTGADEYGKVMYVNAAQNRPVGEQDGLSWDTAFKYLQDALADVVAGDEIWVAEGIYYPDEGDGQTDDDRDSTFQLVKKVAIYGGFVAGAATLDERDLVNNVTILNGDVDVEDTLPDGKTIYTRNSYHVVTGADNAVLDGFTITNGYVEETSIPGGAGIYCNGTSPTIRNCTITNNFAKADRFGGGVYADGTSSPKLINCLIAGNFAQAEHCGGIYHAGTGTLELINCTIVDNANDGVHCDGATLLMDNCIVWHNRLDLSYDEREIVLNSSTADIKYSNVEAGQAGIFQSSSTLTTDLPANNCPDPQVEEWGQWTLERYDGVALEKGTTTLTAKADEITIYDFTANFSDMSTNENHDEDEFVDDFLVTESGNYYKTPQIMDSPVNTSTIARSGNGEWKFKLWYAPDPDGNKRGPINTNRQVPSRYCVDAAKGVFELNSDHFFPIDNCVVPNECFGVESHPKCYCASCDKYHNYFFTLQYHTHFTYVPGQVFEFEASDDLIVAINDRVILSREGFFVTCTSQSTIELVDGYAYITTSNADCATGTQTLDPIDLGLEPYSTNDFDLFYANRNVPRSVLKAQWTPGESEVVATFELGDYHLAVGSPCIDAGDNTAVPGQVEGDLDGYPRFVDDPETDDAIQNASPEVDMGAYEFQVPIAMDDEYTVAKGQTLNISAPGVLENDEDPEGDPLTAVKQSDPYNGSVTLDSDGSFVYTPTSGYVGTDSFTYKATDTVDNLDSPIATVTITITNSGPVALNDTAQTSQNNGVDINVLSNDSDPENDTLTVGEIVLASAAHGTAVNNEQNIRYTPATDFYGQDSFTYMAYDGTEYSNEAIVTVTVRAFPVSADDSYEAAVNQTLHVSAPGVLVNDQDLDSVILTASLETGVSHGTLDLNNGGSFTYTPNADFFGDDSFTYRCSDGTLPSAIATVTIHVYQAVKVDAGGDKSVTFPVNTVDLSDALVTGGLPSTLAMQWSLVSAPLGCQVDFNVLTEGSVEETSSQQNPTVRLLGITPAHFAVGQVQFRLKLKADDGKTNGQDELLITVYPGADGHVGPAVTVGIQPGDIYAGQAVNLFGSVSDDGLLYGMLNARWELVPDASTLDGVDFGTGEFQFSRAKGDEVVWGHEFSANTTAVFSGPGDYVLKLTASDMSESNSAILRFHVLSTAPAANAGSDTTIEDNTYSPSGVWVKDDRLPEPVKLTYSWSVTGPTAGAYIVPQQGEIIDHEANVEKPLSPTFTFRHPGVYTFTLTVSDGAESASDSMTITVNGPVASNQFSATAGDDRLITLPDYVDLDGIITINDIDYTNGYTGVAVKWSQIEGPGIVSFDDNTLLDTIARFSQPGEYTLKLEGQYGVLTATDEVVITVNPVKPGTKIAGGEDHTMIVSPDGAVWTCGDNFYGQLGDGTEGEGHEKELLVKVLAGDQNSGSPLLSNIFSVAGGWKHSLALDKDNNVWAWGNNLAGQLGDGTNVESNGLPVHVHASDYTPGNPIYLSNVVAIATGRSGTHSLAVDRAGNVWSWGYNYYGQLGIDNTNNQSTPVKVLKGEQDSGDQTYLSNIVAVSGGAFHSMALEKLDLGIEGCEGRVYSFGHNGYPDVRETENNCGAGTCYGLLGNDNNQDSPTPVLVHAGEQDYPDHPTYLSNIVAISAGWHHSMALEKLAGNGCTGKVYTWGFNGASKNYLHLTGGRLGLSYMTQGGVTNASAPVMVKHASGQALENIIAISSGESHCMALDNDGHVWTWGIDMYGQLGRGDYIDPAPYVPKRVVDYDGVGDLGDEAPIVAIAAGYWHCLAMDELGNIYGWGLGADCWVHGSSGLVFSENGRLGIGDTENKNIPQLVPPPGARVHNEDSDEWFEEINDAIADEDTEDNDTITVHPGTYRGPVVLDESEDYPDNNKNLTIRSSDPTNPDVVSRTILDGEGNSVIKLGGGNTSTITGFTITHGYNGIDCSHVYEDVGASPTITNSIICHNINRGIYCTYPEADLQIKNCLIYDSGQGGIWLVAPVESGAVVRNNTIVNNIGYGFYQTSGELVDVSNCILVDNQFDDQSMNIGSNGVPINLAYCGIGDDIDTISGIISGGEGVIDNLVSSSIFEDGDYLYELKSDASNPCINAGDLSGNYSGETDIAGKPRILGGQVDIGANEYMPYMVEAGERKTVIVGQSIDMSDAAIASKVFTPSPSTLTVLWSVVSGPDGWNNPPCNIRPCPFEDDVVLKANATFTKVGIYRLKLEVSENGNVVGEDFVEVEVLYDLEITASPQVLAIPDATTTLTASITGDWPSGCTVYWFGSISPEVLFNPETGYSTDVTFTEPGIYPITAVLTNDATGALLGEATIDIFVNFQQIDVEIHADRETITWPDNTVNLWVTVQGGTASSVTWYPPEDTDGLVHFGGDGNPGIHDFQTPVTFGSWGVHPITVVAKDEWGYTIGVGIITITVNSPDVSSIIVDAGQDQQIDLPQNFVFLRGEVHDPTGIVNRYQWYPPIDSSGDPVATFNVDNQLEVMATFTGVPLLPGEYPFTLAAIHDDGAEEYIVGSNTVTITITGTGDQYVSPVGASITADDDVVLPISGIETITLNGAITGQLGLVDLTKTEWVCYSGQNYISLNPVSASVGTVTPQAAATFTAPGQYYIGLLVKNGDEQVIASATTVINVRTNSGQSVEVQLTAKPTSVTLHADEVYLRATVNSGSYDWVQWSDTSGTVLFTDESYVSGQNGLTATATARFSAVGTYTLKFTVRSGGADGTIVGWESVQVSVIAPTALVEAKAGATDQTEAEGPYAVVYNNQSVTVYLDGQTYGLSGTLSYEWSCVQWPGSTRPTPETPTSGAQSSVNLADVGTYVFTLSAYEDSELVGSGQVTVVLLSGRPVVNAGRRYPIFKAHETEEIWTTLAKAYVLDDQTINVGNIYWASVPSDGVSWDPIATHAEKPDIRFTNTDIYQLTLTYDDQIFDSVSDSVTVFAVNTVTVNAGVPKDAVPFEEVHLNDVQIDPPYADLIYQWTVTEKPTDAVVTFIDPETGLPGDSIIEPVVTFDRDGEYVLTLTVRVDSGSNIEDIGSGTVYVSVVTPEWLDEDILPEITTADIDGIPFGGYDTEDFLCGQLNIVVEASDEHIQTIYLKLDNDKLSPEDFVTYEMQVLEGSPETPRKLRFSCTLDTHSLPDGSARALTAYARDRAGNLSTPATANFSTNCKIYDYKVSPQSIAVPGLSVLTFSADFDGTSTYNWAFEIFAANDTEMTSLLFDSSSSGNPSPGMSQEVDFSSWPHGDGNYKARLTADPGANQETAFVYFDVAMNLSEDRLVAQLHEDLKVTRDGNGIPNESRTVITEGTFELQGKAYHMDGLSDVSYKVLLSNAEGFSRNVTGGTLDAAGYHQGSVGNESDYGILANLDMSSFENGVYTITLMVRCYDQVQSDSTEIVLDCPLKLGNVKFSQEDMSINVGGIPIQVVRTYDSFKKDKDGELGYGWSYSLANMDISLNETRVPKGSYTERSGDAYNRDVTLTLPTGQRVTFASSYNDDYQLNYEDIPAGIGVKRFTTLGFEQILIDKRGLEAAQLWNGDNWCGTSEYLQYQDYCLSLHDVSGYELTMDDGTVYTIARKAYDQQTVTVPYDDWGNTIDIYYYTPYGKPYLQSIKLPSGEKLDFTVDDVTDPENPITDGVDHYLAGGTTPTKSITIYRGPFGRITEICAPADDESLPSLKYEYDNGYLSKVHKLVNRQAATFAEQYETTTYEYRGRLVTDIKDPRGLSPIQYIYDEAGKLVATKDAKGNEIKLSHALEDDDGKYELVSDRSGSKTKYYYNARGNVELIQRLNVDNVILDTTQYVYPPEDAEYLDNPLQMIRQVPDPANPGSTVEAVTRYEYDAEGRQRLVIDPAYNAIETECDLNSNVLWAKQWKPLSATPVFPQDYEEVSTARNFYAANNLLYMTGVTTGATGYLTWHSISLTFYEDDNNRVVKSVQVDVENSTELENVFNSDNPQIGEVRLHNDLRDNYTWSHVMSEYGYFESPSADGYSPDQPYSVTDASQNTQYFWYDENNVQKASWTFWDDPTTPTTETVRILNISETDAQGRSTGSLRITDDNETLVGTIMSNVDAYISAHPEFEVLPLSETVYNEIGKVDYSVDPSTGILTKYEYDETGNLVETLVYESYDDFATYYQSYPGDTTGILTISRTLYDAEGRAIVSVGPYAVGDEPVGTETVYDALGRVERTRRWANVEITLEDLYGTGGQIVVARKVPQNRLAQNAWEGTPSGTLAWTADGVQPVAGDKLSYSRTEYDAAGRAYKTYTQNEDETEICTTEYVYDAAGRQIQTITLPDDVDNRTVTETHYDGTRRDYVVDARGFEEGADPADYTTFFVYDDLGRVITTVHPASIVEEGGANPVATYSHVGYDGLGRKTWETTPIIADGDTVPVDLDTEAKQFRYDTAGRLVMVILPQVKKNPPADNTLVHPVYRYYYDSYGNQRAILDPLGRATVFEYDHLNRLKKKYMPFEVTFTNPQPDLTDESYYAGLENDIYTNLANVTPLFEETWYDDNNYGRVDYVMDYKEQVTQYVYDTQGRLEYKRYYETGDYPTTVTEYEYYTYDALGRQDEITKDGVLQQKFYYDVEGRIHAIDSPQGVIEYLYSPVTGQKTDVITYAAGTLYEDIVNETATPASSTAYGYDDLGRLDNVNDTTHYTYTTVGSRGNLEYANGNFTEYLYNPLNRLTNLTNYPTDAKTTALSSFNYTLKANGMRASVTETVKVGATPTNETRTVEYGYDTLNRLTDETAVSGANGYAIDYTYDLAGNRTQRIVTIGGQVLTTVYDYDQDTDHLETEVHSGPTTCMVIGNERYYAYASPSGSVYYLDNSGKRINGVEAFISGLPLAFNQWLSRILMALIPIVFFCPALRLSFPRRRESSEYELSPDLRLWHRMLCVLLAYIFLIGPEVFHQLARADMAYSELCTVDWANGGETVYYQYDANGSMTQKLTAPTAEPNPETNYTEKVVYGYNLQNRLSRIETYDNTQTLVNVVEYAYNPDGIRTQKIDDPDGTPVVTTYLIDPYNHTGYAQVLEETTGSDVKNYLIGDDMLAQTLNSNSPQCLLYDGHGSTRQVVASDGSTIVDSYSYDAYGVMLGGNPTTAAPAATNLLYAGEQFDADAGQYYLRARYYNQNNGTFNQMDNFAGNLHDPQSLHKYLYCHANPVNGIDPTGREFSIMGVSVTMFVMLVLFSQNIANAPGPDSVTLPDTTGEAIIDCFYMLAGSLLLRFVIAPVFQQGVKYVRGLRPVRTPVPSEPGAWYKVKEGMSPRAAAYQTKITGQPVENGYVVNGVKFDGFKSGTLLDAKGPGYKNFVQNGEFNSTWFRGSDALVDQAERQLSAAGGAPIEWHFAEKESLEAVEQLFAEKSIEGIKLIYIPIQ